MAKKVKAPPKKLTVLEHIAQQTGTDAADWAYVTKSHRMYRRGFRYVNIKTNQYAKRGQDE